MFLKVTRNWNEKTFSFKRGDIIEIVEVGTNFHKLRMNDKTYLVRSNKIHKFTELVECQLSKL